MSGRGLTLLRTNHAFRVYFSGRITSVLGGAVAPVALAFAILDAGGGGTGIAIVLGTEYAVWMLLMPLIGVLADRTGDLRRLLIGSQIAAATFQGIEAALILTGTADVTALAVVAAAGATAASVSYLGGTRLMPQIVPPHQLARANATLRTVQMAVAAIGPAVAGIAVATVGPGWCIAWDAVTFLGAALCSPGCPTRPRPRPAPVVRRVPGSRRAGKRSAAVDGCGP